MERFQAKPTPRGISIAQDKLPRSARTFLFFIYLFFRNPLEASRVRTSTGHESRCEVGY